MFLIDQGIGVHHAQVESLGYGWSWVSVEAAVDTSVRYHWANVTRLNVDVFGRLTAYTDSTRSEVKCENRRTE